MVIHINNNIKHSAINTYFLQFKPKCISHTISNALLQSMNEQNRLLKQNKSTACVQDIIIFTKLAQPCIKYVSKELAKTTQECNSLIVVTVLNVPILLIDWDQ